jgi:hypothetical protein
LNRWLVGLNFNPTNQPTNACYVRMIAYGSTYSGCFAPQYWHSSEAMGISLLHLAHFFRNFLGASRTLRRFFLPCRKNSKEEISNETARPNAGKGMTPLSAIAFADRPKNSKKNRIDSARKKNPPTRFMLFRVS